MKVVIISEFGEDYSLTDNDRFLYLAKTLASTYTDIEVELVTSSFRHSTKEQRKEAMSEWPFRITFINEPGYRKNVCIKRLCSHMLWGRNVTKYIKSLSNKPDVVYCAIPSLTGPSKIAKYCEKEKIRFVIDIQDLWPEAFEMVFRVPIVSSLFFLPLRLIADGIYRRANTICAVSETYCKRAVGNNKKNMSVVPVYIGTDLVRFDRYTSEKAEYKKEDNEIWIAYCGTLGSSYDICCVIDAISLVNDSRIKFVVMGDGPLKGEFEMYSKKKGVNSIFLGRVSYNNMCCILKKCDITVNPIRHGSAGSIINKHADYAASGLPVLNTQENNEYRNLVEKYNMGFNCKNGDANDLSEKIKLLINNDQVRVEMGKNSRRCAEERFDRNRTYCALVETIK